jgi:putative salt-induced outer membrane protein YdiY
LILALPLRADDPPVPPPPPPPWSGEASGSWVQNTGNSISQSIGAGLALGYESAPWKMTFKSDFVRNSSEDVKQAEKLSGLLRGERALGDRVSLFAQASALRDEFAGFDGQETLEAGAIVKLARGPKHKLSLGAGLGYTAEQRQLPDEDRSYASARLGLGYKWALSATAQFSEDANLLADLGDSANWHGSTLTALTAEVSKILALRVSHQLAYAHQPVPGKRATDTTFLASVVAKWPAAAAK